MTAIQMNAEILRNMSIIAEDEHLLKRVAKYLRKVVAEKEDPTLFTKEEFFARHSEAYVQENFGGSLPAFLAAFSTHKKLSENEIDEMKKLIEKMRG
mgnify:CR=1 FL=1